MKKYSDIFCIYLASGSMDSCLMVWNFKPNMRAYRFVGHKVSMNDNLHISQNIINIGYQFIGFSSSRPY